MQQATMPKLHPTTNAPSHGERDARKREATERAQARVASLSAAELNDFVLVLLRRAQGSARVAHMATQLSADSQPSAAQIAKCVEVALFNTEEALHISWSAGPGIHLTDINSDLDQAEGVLAAIDVKLWDDGWTEISNIDAVSGALDAAAYILEVCVSYLEACRAEGRVVSH